MLLAVTLTDTETGRTKTQVVPLEEGTICFWTQGNFSCDCNRSYDLYENQHDLDCNVGDNRIIAEFAKLRGAS